MTASHKSLTSARWSIPALLVILTAFHAAGAMAQTGAIDHSAFGRVLASAAANGRVDYARFRGNADFAAYQASIGNASLRGASADEQMAFWLNAYNASVIRNVIDNPGMRRPIDVKGFFDARTFRIAGSTLTLNDMENRMLRERFREPLIHFGLVCAARSCPPLQPRTFDARTVRAQLARNATAYLASAYNRFDAATNTLTLSKIFDWYKGDFGGDAGIREFVKKYGTPAMRQRISSSTTIAFMEYDWTLNSK
ncbi:MAG: hypothetical protein JWQ98_3458 [Chlorobi bacterium]|nr:hypothetical protein [Chlorobiota bacterium]